MRVSLFITCTTHHSLTQVRRTCGEGNIMGQEVYCCWEISYYFGADFISKEVAGFSPLWFPQGKLFVSRVSCDVLMFIAVLVILSVKRS